MKYILVTLMGVSLFLSIFVLPSGMRKTAEAGSVSAKGNAAIVSEYDIRLENLNFTVSRIEKEYAVMKAEFDLESPRELPGELYIEINGKYPANGRLIVKQGSAHYSLDFYLPDPEQGLLNIYMADVTLKTNGKISYSVKKQFAMLNYSASVY
jgi:hypothetical protein